ncbi:MAG: ArsC family transcriptional regulator [Kovacikia sp.]
MAQPKRILFVCRKNSCRSQMAEGFAQSLGEPYIVASSAGIYSSQIDPRTIEVMAEEGIDISRNTAKCLNEFTPETFDCIVTMCASASKLNEVWKLKILEEWDIEDPSGQSIKIYRQVRDEIKQRVQNLFVLINLKLLQFNSL